MLLPALQLLRHRMDIAEPPLNDLWTIPGEENQLAGYQAEDRTRFAQDLAGEADIAAPG